MIIIHNIVSEKLYTTDDSTSVIERVWEIWKKSLCLTKYDHPYEYFVRLFLTFLSNIIGSASDRDHHQLP